LTKSADDKTRPLSRSKRKSDDSDEERSAKKQRVNKFAHLPKPYLLDPKSPLNLLTLPPYAVPLVVDEHVTVAQSLTYQPPACYWDLLPAAKGVACTETAKKKIKDRYDAFVKRTGYLVPMITSGSTARTCVNNELVGVACAEQTGTLRILNVMDYPAQWHATVQALRVASANVTYRVVSHPFVAPSSAVPAAQASEQAPPSAPAIVSAVVSATAPESVSASLTAPGSMSATTESAK
jgi:hypothetical protein